MNDGSDDGAIFTTNPSAFAKFGFTVPTRLVSVSPPAELLPAAHLVRTRVLRSALEKARSGSKVGAGIERTFKQLARRLRSLDGISPSRRRRAPQIDPASLRSSALYLRLEDEHRHSPIDRIVVFDVFDLPVALAFTETHDIEVLVR